MPLWPYITLAGTAAVAAARRRSRKRTPLIEVKPHPGLSGGLHPWADVVYVSGVRIGYRPRDGASVKDIRREVAVALAKGLEENLKWACMPEEY